MSRNTMDCFFSRCLLCASLPDAGDQAHLHILSQAGKSLQLVEKIQEYLNIQIIDEMPQRLCNSCQARLIITHRLFTESPGARVKLLQIREQLKIEQEIPGTVDPQVTGIFPDIKQEYGFFEDDAFQDLNLTGYVTFSFYILCIIP
ncbi:hypothetical protein B566_EDAN014289 [Ephemera danica]|nr:hypothetical protein B566_EDAN014289 [Ephemera danica]